MSEQDEELRRVQKRIRPAIRRFLATGPSRFHLEDLDAFVEREVGKVASGSVSRILRQLRLEGECDYRVISRRDSLYEVTV